MPCITARCRRTRSRSDPESAHSGLVEELRGGSRVPARPLTTALHQACGGHGSARRCQQSASLRLGTRSSRLFLNRACAAAYPVSQADYAPFDFLQGALPVSVVLPRRLDQVGNRLQLGNDLATCHRTSSSSPPSTQSVGGDNRRTSRLSRTCQSP